MAKNKLKNTLYMSALAGMVALTSSCGMMTQLTTNKPETLENIRLQNIKTVYPANKDSIDAFYVNNEYENKLIGENKIKPIEYHLTIPNSRKGLLDSLEQYKASFEASKVDESELYEYSYINDKPKKVYRINPSTIEFYKK